MCALVLAGFVFINFYRKETGFVSELPAAEDPHQVNTSSIGPSIQTLKRFSTSAKYYENWRTCCNMPVPARAKGQGDGLSFDVGFASAE
jgi:hypothetical protein